MKESAVTGVPSEKVQPSLILTVKVWLSEVSMDSATSFTTVPSLL